MKISKKSHDGSQTRRNFKSDEKSVHRAANESYTENDLRKIIYTEGVHKSYLIRATISIHKSAASLSEFSTFGVSQLTKMFFLFPKQR
jgi:hypothetical protein